MPAGVPAPARPAAPRDEAGRFRQGPGTSAIARKGAQARHEARELDKLLGLVPLDETHPRAPYRRMARQWRDGHMARLADTVGAGEVGPGPASVVASAALQLSASRWLYDLALETGDADLALKASRLANDSRNSLLAAQELTAAEAKARGKRREPVDIVAYFTRGAGSAGKSRADDPEDRRGLTRGRKKYGGTASAGTTSTHAEGSDDPPLDDPFSEEPGE